MRVWVKKEDVLAVVRVSYFLIVHIPAFWTILTDGKMNNIIILQLQLQLQLQRALCFSLINLRVQTGHHFLSQI